VDSPDPEREYEVDDLDPNTFDLGEIREVPDDKRAGSPVTPRTPLTPFHP